MEEVASRAQDLLSRFDGMKKDKTFTECSLVSNLVGLQPLSLTDQDAIVEACNDQEIQRQREGSGLVIAIEHEGKFAGVIEIKRTD